MSGVRTEGLDDGIKYIKVALEAKLSLSSRPVVVGIAGPTGSGKGFLCNRLEQEFSDSTRLAMDNYFLGLKYMALHHVGTFDHPDAVNLRLLANHAAMLASGNAVEEPIYSFTRGEPAQETKTVRPAPIIFIEGLFVLREPLRSLLDMAIFVDAGVHSTLWRRILRDVKRTNQTESQIMHMFLTEAYPGYAKFILPTRASADVIVVNEMFPGEIETVLPKQHQMRMRVADRSHLYDRDRMIGIVLSAGFHEAGRVHQHDVRLIPPRTHNTLGDELLRARTQFSFSRVDDVYCTISYKSPASAAQRGFCEFPITSKIRDALVAIGYRKGRSLTKNRTIYRPNEDGSCEITLDEFSISRSNASVVTGQEELVIYLEVRSDTEEGLEDCIRRLCDLGVMQSRLTSKSYWDILELIP